MAAEGGDQFSSGMRTLRGFCEVGKEKTRSEVGEKQKGKERGRVRTSQTIKRMTCHLQENG